MIGADLRILVVGAGIGRLGAGIGRLGADLPGNPTRALRALGLRQWGRNIFHANYRSLLELP